MQILVYNHIYKLYEDKDFYIFTDFYRREQSRAQWVTTDIADHDTCKMSQLSCFFHYASPNVKAWLYTGTNYTCCYHEPPMIKAG